LHTLLNLRTLKDLEGHPKIGASWESFVLFWATHAGAELDLLVVRGRRRLGFEIKRTSSPQITKSMHNALSDLKLSQLDIIHAGDYTFPLSRQVRAISSSRLLKDLKPLL
jgi:predicted AAA+ superfamily ATPase